MNNRRSFVQWAAMLALGAGSASSFAAYNSGSTGTDGAFNPTTSQAVQLPANGVFNFTSVNIPSGVTITFIKNAANTPVTILASGDVTVAGTIDVSATSNPADISAPGIAGPGGYDGGRGGQAGGDAANWINGTGGANVGRAGLGPGGGAAGPVYKPAFSGSPGVAPGGGGAFGTAPPAASGTCAVSPGAIYGGTTLLPLVGGSGGGGGAGGAVLPGMGGGGGGGAILIAASGTINVTGSILANGGVPPASSTSGRGAQGGGGSGGAIRLVASTVSGNGTISAAGGSVSGEYAWQYVGTTYVVCSNQAGGSQSGGAGRIRIESENLTRTATTNPLYIGGSVGPIFVPGLPALSISSVGGIPVPAVPTGRGDVQLPASAANPITVAFTTTGVTVGTAVKLTVIPPSGPAVTATSAPTTGTIDNATASVSVNLPSGSSILQASLTYTVVASVGDAMSVYAQGERVDQVRLTAALGGAPTATLITVSGKEFEVPAAVLAAATVS